MHPMHVRYRTALRPDLITLIRVNELPKIMAEKFNYNIYCNSVRNQLSQRGTKVTIVIVYLEQV